MCGRWRKNSDQALRKCTLRRSPRRTCVVTQPHCTDCKCPTAVLLHLKHFVVEGMVGVEQISDAGSRRGAVGAAMASSAVRRRRARPMPCSWAAAGRGVERAAGGGVRLLPARLQACPYGIARFRWRRTCGVRHADAVLRSRVLRLLHAVRDAPTGALAYGGRRMRPAWPWW